MILLNTLLGTFTPCYTILFIIQYFKNCNELLVYYTIDCLEIFILAGVTQMTQRRIDYLHEQNNYFQAIMSAGGKRIFTVSDSKCDLLDLLHTRM